MESYNSSTAMAIKSAATRHLSCLTNSSKNGIKPQYLSCNEAYDLICGG